MVKDAWSTLPQPLAELALNLMPSDGAYLQGALRLAECSLAFALSCALASARARGEAPPSVVWGSLRTPTMGHYVEALRALDASRQGCTGWHLDDTVDGARALLDVLGVRAGKRPAVRHVLDALPNVRNTWGHHRELADSPRRLGDLVKGAVLELLTLNVWARDYRLLYLTDVQAGSFAFQAKALEGSGLATFVTSDGARLPGASQQGHVVLLARRSGAMTPEMLDLHPFVRSDGEAAYLLTTASETAASLVRPRGPNVWKGDGDELARQLADWIASATISDAHGLSVNQGASAVASLRPIAAEARPAGPSLGGRVGVVIALAFAALAALGLLGVAVVAGVGAVGGDASESPTFASSVTVRASDPTLEWLTGLPLAWGMSPAEVEATLGQGVPPDIDCDAPFLRSLDVALARRLAPAVPNVTGGGIAVHRTAGLLDVTFLSSAEPDVATAIVGARLGAPTDVLGRRATWQRGDMSVRVAAARAGGSVIRAWDTARRQVLDADRHSAGCPD